MNIYYVDGQFVEEHEAKIPVDDLAVLRGFGIFDFLRTYNGAPFHLEEHLLRLQRSARFIGLQLPKSPAALTEIVHETLARNEHEESNIRIVVTGGISDDGITPGHTPRLLVLVSPVTPMPQKWYSDGAKIVTCHTERFMPGAKSINYIPAILCQAAARDQQAIEAVYVDRNGFLLEATTSNLFVRRGDTLITPPCERILPGITRRVVFDMARQHFEVVERPVHQDEIRLFDEVFLTSSVKEVVPIVTIDSVSIGDGKPGPYTLALMKMFKAYTAAYA